MKYTLDEAFDIAFGNAEWVLRRERAAAQAAAQAASRESIQRVAKNLLSRNTPVDFIASVTGFNQGDIANITP